MKFEAGIHGIDLDKDSDDDEGWLCVDPKDYEHLSKEEREALTKERLNKFSKQMDK